MERGCNFHIYMKFIIIDLDAWGERAKQFSSSANRNGKNNSEKILHEIETRGESKNIENAHSMLLLCCYYYYCYSPSLLLLLLLLVKGKLQLSGWKVSNHAHLIYCDCYGKFSTNNFSLNNYNFTFILL